MGDLSPEPRGAMGAALLKVFYDKFGMLSHDAMQGVYEILRTLEAEGYEIRQKQEE